MASRYELWLQEKERIRALKRQHRLEENARKKDRLAWAEFQATHPYFLRTQKVLDHLEDEPMVGGSPMP